MERRRSWAAAGRLPPSLASRFTLDEGMSAVLAFASVQVREAATPDRPGRGVEAPAAIAEEALSRAHRVARAREHAEQLMAQFRQVHAIAGERNPYM